MLLTYIFNDKLDYLYNYSNKKETILQAYTDRLAPYESQSLFYYEDKTDSSHTLEQVCKISSFYKSDYLFIGYGGIKGPRGDNNELNNGINYLLSFSKTPVLLIQENLVALRREKNKFNWLFIFDRQYSSCTNIMKPFFKLVDPEKDKVYGYTLLPSHITIDDVESIFKKECEMMKFKNIFYENFTYETVSYAKETVEKINFGNIDYNFVVFYNNSEKYRAVGEKSDSFLYLMKCKSSLCFVN